MDGGGRGDSVPPVPLRPAEVGEELAHRVLGEGREIRRGEPQAAGECFVVLRVVPRRVGDRAVVVLPGTEVFDVLPRQSPGDLVLRRQPVPLLDVTGDPVVCLRAVEGGTVEIQCHR